MRSKELLVIVRCASFTCSKVTPIDLKVFEFQQLEYINTPGRDLVQIRRLSLYHHCDRIVYSPLSEHGGGRRLPLLQR